jgi:hypothetical protein
MKWKVEVKVGPLWVPASHKYWKEKDKAKAFQDRFKKKTGAEVRTKRIGKDKHPFNTVGYPFFNVVLLYSWIFAHLCSILM